MRKFLFMAALTLAAGPAAAQEMPPAGGEEDIAYAALLWEVMQAGRLAGPDAIQGFPYEGLEPHGLMLTTMFTEATVEGHSGTLVVKNNYGPAGVTTDEVLGAPDEHLAAVTIMFKREAGYDTENQDWFYAKYLPDGSLDRNPAGMALAGRVGKGADAGCIACHIGAEGDDYLFTTNADLGAAMSQ